MQMISRKIIFFSVCLHSRKMLQKIIYIMCLEQFKTKQQQKPTPKTTGIDQKWEPPPRATLQTHREPPRNLPRASLQPTASQTPTEIDPKPTNTHCTKPKIKLKINQTPSTSKHRQHLNPSPATP